MLHERVTRVKNDRVACHDTALARYPSKKLLANSGNLVTCFLLLSVAKQGNYFIS